MTHTALKDQLKVPYLFKIKTNYSSGWGVADLLVSDLLHLVLLLLLVPTARLAA